ncbi:MAG: hypothetical protein AB7J46_06645 [Candidatus Altimarinota bacterium]
MQTNSSDFYEKLNELTDYPPSPKPPLKQTSGPCVVRGCIEPGVCLDEKNYTQRRSELTAGLFEDEEFFDLPENRQIWFCNAHAVKYLFPIIEQLAGNSVGNILNDFADDGLM